MMVGELVALDDKITPPPSANLLESLLEILQLDVNHVDGGPLLGLVLDRTLLKAVLERTES